MSNSDVHTIPNHKLDTSTLAGLQHAQEPAIITSWKRPRAILLPLPLDWQSSPILAERLQEMLAIALQGIRK